MARTKLPTKQIAATLIVSDNARNVIAADDSVVLSGADRKLYTSYSVTIPSIDIDNRLLKNSAGATVFDYQSSILSAGVTQEGVRLSWQKITIVAGDFIIPPIGTGVTEDRADVLLVDASSGPVEITLPYAGPSEEFLAIDGKPFIVKKTDSTGNAVTIVPAAGDGSAIDGQASYSLPIQYSSVAVIGGNFTWHVVPKSATNVVDAAGGIVVNGADRKIYGANSPVIPAIDIQNHQLIGNSGLVTFDFDGGDFPNGASILSIPIGWQKVIAVTVDYVVPAINPTVPASRTDVILVDASLGPVLITIPPPLVFEEGGADPTGKSFTIKKTDSSGNAVTIASALSQLIDGSLTRVLVTQYDVLTVIAGGDTWNITSKIVN